MKIVGLSKVASVLAIIGLVSTSAMADWDFDVHGQITAVNDAQKTVTIGGATGELTIKVLPHTEIKGDDCGAFGQDIYGTFKDLTVGKFIQIEALPAGGYNAYNTTNAGAVDPKTGLPANMELVAKEIEWKCRPSAY